MLNKELVEQNECGNDGKTVNLYFDQMTGVYLAFGLSAYYTTMLVNVFACEDASAVPAEGGTPTEGFLQV